MGILLLLTASILKMALSPFGYAYGAIKSLIKCEFSKWNTDLALAKDQYGNALCKYLFNDLLITKNGYSFGNIDETISSCIGKNKVKGTLTSVGKILDKILDLLDRNHSIKSIDNEL